MVLQDSEESHIGFGFENKKRWFLISLFPVFIDLKKNYEISGMNC